MTLQLVLSLGNTQGNSILGKGLRWCWLGADGIQGAASGDAQALREALAGQGSSLSTWLVLPGAKVVTRALSYSEKEKKHLRNLLPYQLEDAVVGDVEDFHFAFSTPAKGHVALAYTDRSWLQAVFAELAALGLEVTRCWSAPLTLPLVDGAALDNGAPDQAIAEHWTLGLYQGQLLLRQSANQGWSCPLSQAPLALGLLLAERQGEPLPAVHLRAADATTLALVEQQLPAALQTLIASRELVDDWALDFKQAGIDLCQGEFSQRLPFARWWSLWKPLSILAGVCLLVFLVASLLEIRQLSKDNLAMRQQMEAVAREVIPQGRLLDPEKQLAGMLRQMEPSQAGGNVMALLGKTLPAAAQVSSVRIKGFAFSAETGELNINIEADSFGNFEELSKKIEERGLEAELLSANVQGNVQTARLKVSRKQ